MKEFNEEFIVNFELTNPKTGENIPIQGTSKSTSKYYNITKLTSRINSMNLFELQEKICKSSTDIKIFRILLENADRYNETRINVTKLSKELNISRRKLTNFLKLALNTKSSEDESLLLKLDIGIYFVNPFIFSSKSMRSNKLREQAQEKWLLEKEEQRKKLEELK